MISRRTLVFTSIAGVTPGVQWLVAPVTPGTPLPAFGIVMLEPGDLPDGMEVVQDGERTLDDVVANFPDPVEAARRFRAWNWKGNLVRAYHLPSGPHLEPGDIDGVYLSVHAFGSAQDAQEATTYIVNVHATSLGVTPSDDTRFGGDALALYATQSYGREITWYVPLGQFVLRCSSSAPEGDPRPQAEPLMARWLERNDAADQVS